MTVFQFELKKLLFSRKFLLIMLFLMIGVLLLFIRNYTFQEEIIKEELRAIDQQIQMSRTNSKVHLAQLDQDPNDHEAQQMDKANDEIYTALYELLSLYTEGNWQQNLQLQNDIWEKSIMYSDLGGETVFSKEKMTESIAINEELLTRDIAPEHEHVSITLPNYLSQIIYIWTYGGAFLLFLILMGDVLSVEFDTYSIKLLFTQPLKKSDIIASKFMTAVIAYFMMLLIVVLTSISVSFLFGETGALSYPLLNVQDGTVEFVSIAVYMMRSLVMTTVFILFILALILAYSIVMKNTLVLLGGVVITCFVGYAMTLLPTFESVLWVNPFVYLWPNEQVNALSKDWYIALPMTIACILCLYFFSKYKIKHTFVER